MVHDPPCSHCKQIIFVVVRLHIKFDFDFDFESHYHLFAEVVCHELAAHGYYCATICGGVSFFKPSFTAEKEKDELF